MDLASGTVRAQWEGQSAFPPFQLQEKHRVSILNGGVSDNPTVNEAEITALKNGILYFDDSDIRTILTAVSRWNDVTIHYEGAIPDKKYSLHVPIGTNLSVIVEDLKNQGAPVLIQGKTITVLK